MRWLRTRGRPEITSPVATKKIRDALLTLRKPKYRWVWSRASDETASALVSNNAMVRHQINDARECGARF